MDKQRSKIAPKIYTNSRHVTISPDDPTPNDYRSFENDQQSSGNSLKITISTQKYQPGKQAENVISKNQRQTAKQEYRNEQQPPARGKNNNKNNQKDENNAPQGQKPKDAGVRCIKELSSKHLESLKNTFNKVVREQFLSKTDREQHLLIYNQLRDFILEQRPDAQITLYGSLLFECYLKETSMIDIDVQFKETLPYETLKELLKIVRNWVSCKEVHINIDNDPLSIDVTVLNSNILVRLTSNNIPAIQLSRLIEIYTKFDKRILSLLRLFRIFSKICHIDQRDLGTLHPVAFHMMTIHFLQQLDPPVLPCLHEYVFGIDKAPVALNNDQYVDFLQVCNEYTDRWKSTNTTSVEMLFLQLLSYYVRRFDAKRLVVSIQTRMPLLRITKKAIHNQSLFFTDPISINKNVCYSLRARRLITYFCRTLETALNYFCQTPKYENTNENLYYTIDEYDDIVLVKQLVETIHKSYNLFIDRYSNRSDYWKNVQQEDLRQHFKKTFDSVNNPIPQPILKLKENNTMLLLNDDDNEDDDNDDGENTEKIEEISRQDTEIIRDTDQIEDNKQIATSQNEHQSIVEEANAVENTSNNETDNESIAEELVLFKTLAEHLDEKQEAILRKEYDEQVRLFNDKMRQILNDIKSLSVSETCPDKLCSHSEKESTELNSSFDQDKQVKTTDTTSSLNPPELFYDIQAKNFGADKGLPTVCSICFRINHMKSNCPELLVPRLVHISKINKQWIDVITRVCRQITDECKPRKEDVKIRQEILEYLRNEFGKCYPACCVHIYGSSYNGFGLRHSDLDICIELKDNNEESNIIVLEKLLQTLQSNTGIFRDVEFVRDARVPIIRSIHSLSNIEIDISLNNILAVENTRLLKTYTEVDSRVSELGYMIKHLAKICDIGDTRTGTLSSYAYVIMLIHFLQQIRPPVLPILQQLNDDPSKKSSIIRECNKWNVYFYDDLTKLKKVWANNTGTNRLTTGELWIEFLRYYIERFNYENNVVTIRQIETLRRDEKGWFNHTIAIEDPFILTHNLADKLSLKKWAIIRQVFIRAREAFAFQPKSWDIQRVHIDSIMEYLFDIDFLCQDNAQKFYQRIRKSKNKQNQKSTSNVNKKENVELPLKPVNEHRNRQVEHGTQSTDSITTSNVTKQTSTTTQSTPR